MQRSIELELFSIRGDYGPDVASGIACLRFQSQDFSFDWIAWCQTSQQEDGRDSHKNREQEEAESSDDVCGIHISQLRCRRVRLKCRRSMCSVNVDVKLNGLPKLVKRSWRYRLACV